MVKDEGETIFVFDLFLLFAIEDVSQLNQDSNVVPTSFDLYKLYNFETSKKLRILYI